MHEAYNKLIELLSEVVSKSMYVDSDGTVENYIDYREAGSIDDADDFEHLADAYKESGNLENAADDWFYSQSWSIDVEDYYNDEIESELSSFVDDLTDETASPFTAEELQDLYYDALETDRYGLFEQCGYYGVNPNAIEYFPGYVKVDILLEPWVDLPYGTVETTVEYMEQNCSIICELLASGGLDITQFVEALKSGNIDSLGKFGKSVAEDMYEGWTDVLMSLTACAKISLEDYCKLASGMATSVTIQPSCYLLGLYNPYDGGGTPLEIELSAPFTIPANRVNMQVDNGRKSSIGWTVSEVYGLGDDAFVEDGITVN